MKLLKAECVFGQNLIWCWKLTNWKRGNIHIQQQQKTQNCKKEKKKKRQESPPLVFCNTRVTVTVTPGLCVFFFGFFWVCTSKVLAAWASMSPLAPPTGTDLLGNLFSDSKEFGYIKVFILISSTPILACFFCLFVCLFPSSKALKGSGF